MRKAKMTVSLTLEDCDFCREYHGYCLELSQIDKKQGNQLLRICISCIGRGLQILGKEV